MASHAGLPGLSNDHVWRAFMVEPQKERVAETILDRNGYVVAVPTETRLRRVSRYIKRKEAVQYPMLIGYIFVRLPENYPWGQLFDYRLIRSIVGTGGLPDRIEDAAMQRLLALSGATLPNRSCPNTRASLAVGDVAEAATGPFAGFSSRIEEVRGKKARMVFQILGAQREVDIPLEDLVAA